MRWKMLLRPGWLALTLVVFAFAATCFTVLAPWQFDRHDERKTFNTALRSSLDAPPRPVSEVLPDGAAPDARTQWSRVRITGEYLADSEVVARLRPILGEPAFEVLTPMRTDAGETVLIDRGFVRPDQQSGVPDYTPPPSGQVTVQARVRIDIPGDGEPVRADGRLQVYGVSSEVVSDAVGLDIRPGYFRLDDGQPGVLEPLPLPQLEAGPFLSYALQWIAFGVMGLLGWAYFTWRELKPGGVLDDSADTAIPATEPADTGTDPAGEPARGRSRRRSGRRSVAEILAEDEADETAHGAPGTDDAPASTTKRR